MNVKVVELGQTGKNITSLSWLILTPGDLEVIGDVKPGDKYSILITVK